MNFREATEEDLVFAADHSISRGKMQPDCVDFVYTLEHDGEPLCVGGFKMMNHTTAWCWIDITDVAGKHIVAIYRVIRDWIEGFRKEHNLIRLQAGVECDFEEAIRMIEHLGFKKESIMRKHTDGRDVFMYVLIGDE